MRFGLRFLTIYLTRDRHASELRRHENLQLLPDPNMPECIDPRVFIRGGLDQDQAYDGPDEQHQDLPRELAHGGPYDAEFGLRLSPPRPIASVEEDQVHHSIAFFGNTQTNEPFSQSENLTDFQFCEEPHPNVREFLGNSYYGHRWIEAIQGDVPDRSPLVSSACREM
jgi:hypothetical protein